MNAALQLEMRNIPKTKADAELWRQKLNGVRTLAHDLSQKLNKALLDAETLNKQLAAAADAKSEAMKAKLEKSTTAVRGLLDVIPANRRYSTRWGQPSRRSTTSRPPSTTCTVSLRRASR